MASGNAGADATGNRSAETRQPGRLPYNDLPAWLPTVWARVVMGCLALLMFGGLAINVSKRFPAHSAVEQRWQLWAALGTIVLSYFLLRIFRRRLVTAGFSALALASAVVMGIITADFAIIAVPKFKRAEIMRPMGAAINGSFPRDAPLGVLRPGFLPYLYYLRPGLIYVQRIEDLPVAVRYVLVRQDDLPTVETVFHERHDTYRIELRVKDKRLKNDSRARWLLLRLNPLPEPSL